MSAITPQSFVLQPGDAMPNSPLPVLIYRGVLAEETPSKAGGFDKLFEANGWAGIWRDGIYDYDHYHSNAHEVLGVAMGSARLRLGGQGGKEIDIKAGDVLVLPAGTGHCRLSKSENFVVIGAYPPGQERYDICRNRDVESELRIARTGLPATDPVTGKAGGLLELWR